MLEILTFLSFVTLLYLLCFKRRPKNFPPGPFSWPIIENVLQVGLEPHKSVLKMKEKYGDVIGLNLLHKRAVFINKQTLIKEAFNLPALCGRPEMITLATKETGIYRGIISTSGKQWQEQRRFAFSYITSGVRNGVAMEGLILHEANGLVNDLTKKCGIPISTTNVFNARVLNSLWNILTGETYAETDLKFIKLMEHTYRVTSNVAIQGIFIYFPKFSRMFPNISGYKKFMEHVHSLLTFVQGIIDHHKETYQEGIQRDFTDSFLQKIATTTDKNSSFYGKIGEESLLQTLYHLYLGGTETVSTTLRWLVFLMAHYPNVQEKLHNNILNKLQPGKMPSLKDRNRLPFVEVVITEVLRYSSILPVGVFHEATEDVHFHGYFIPKGTLVTANQYGIAHDPEIWGDPEIFRPERFLNEDETEIINHREIFPFSTGRRVCPAESLARDQLFLFTLILFKSFKVEFDPNEPIPLLKHVMGSVLSPVNHKVIFSLRNPLFISNKCI